MIKLLGIALVCLLLLTGCVQHTMPVASATPAASCHAKSADASTAVFAGVWTQTFEVTCPGTSANTKAYVVRIDVGMPGIGYETSATQVGTPFGQELPTAFLARTQTRIAVNANLFTNCCHYIPTPLPTALRGLEISGGVLLSPAKNDPPPAKGFPFDTSLAVIGGRPSIMLSTQLPMGVTQAVTGSHRLLNAGVNVAPGQTAGDFFGPNARTLAGLSADRGILLLVAVDGSDSGTSGVTLPQAANLMISFGASDAINLDGGGSTVLAIQGADGQPTLLNVPSAGGGGSCTVPVHGGGCQRYVGASFGVRARPMAPPR